MIRRLVLAALSAVPACLPSAPSSAPSAAVPIESETVAASSARELTLQPICGPPGPWPRASGELGLEGLDIDVRRALDARARASQVATLHIEQSGCNANIEVLACTAPVVWLIRPRLQATLDVYSTFELALAERAAGAGNLVAVANDRMRVSIDRRITSERVVRERALPLHQLQGPDCSRATHWASAIADGTFRVLAGDDTIDVTHCRPGTCAEPVAVRYEPISGF